MFNFSLHNQSEETDVKIFRHVIHCIQEGYQTVIVRIDYDVLILIIAFVSPFLLDVDNSPPVFANISTHNADTWYSINKITTGFVNNVCKALPFFTHLPVATQCPVFIETFILGCLEKCDFTQSLQELSLN